MKDCTTCHPIRHHVAEQYIDEEKPAGGRFCQSISALQSLKSETRIRKNKRSQLNELQKTLILLKQWKVTTLLSYILVSHCKCGDPRSSPLMVSSSCLIQIPMKFLQTFLPRQIQPHSCLLPTKMSLATLDSATVTSVTLLRVFQWTNMLHENPPCPAFAWQTQTSRNFTSLKTGVWQFDDLTSIYLNQLGELRLTMKHVRICQTLFKLCSKVLLCQLIRLN